MQIPDTRNRKEIDLNSLDQHLHLLKLHLMTHILLDKGRALQNSQQSVKE